MKKYYGVLRISSIIEMNLCLLAYWIRRYSLDEHKLWKQIVDFKYDTRNPNIFCCHGNNFSPFWNGVMWEANAGKIGYKWVVSIGIKVRFREDQWIGGTCLAILF
jgi:hypothetical protein